MTRSSSPNSEKRSRARSLVDGEFVDLNSYQATTNIDRTCPEVQPWLYGYDAIKEVETAVTQNPEVFSKSASWMSDSVVHISN